MGLRRYELTCLVAVAAPWLLFCGTPSEESGGEDVVVHSRRDAGRRVDAGAGLDAANAGLDAGGGNPGSSDSGVVTDAGASTDGAVGQPDACVAADAGFERADAATSAEDAGGLDGSVQADAGIPGKQLHYFTTFTAPSVVTAGDSVPMTFVGGLATAEVAAAGTEVSFHVRDGVSGDEDHPPGGGSYHWPADMDEAWLWKGALFDVDPRTLTVDMIDCHTHPYKRTATGFEYDHGALVTLLPEQGIDLAITMHRTTLAEQRTQVGALAAAYPWVVALVWVKADVDDVATVEAMLRDDGFRGLKFHPTVHDYPADGTKMDAFMEVARRYQVAVQIHSAIDDNAKPERVAALAQRFPDVKIVMIHTELGAHDKTHALNLIKDLPNVYAETSWANPESVLQAMEVLDSSRVLFGTDATVDEYEQFSKKSIANPQGQYVYSVLDVIQRVKAEAHPDAYANWAWLNAVRVHGLRFAGKR